MVRTRGGITTADRQAVKEWESRLPRGLRCAARETPARGLPCSAGRLPLRTKPAFWDPLTPLSKGATSNPSLSSPGPLHSPPAPLLAARGPCTAHQPRLPSHRQLERLQQRLCAVEQRVAVRGGSGVHAAGPVERRAHGLGLPWRVEHRQALQGSGAGGTIRGMAGASRWAG